MKNKILDFLETELKKRESEFWEVAHDGDPRVWERQGKYHQTADILKEVKKMYEDDDNDYS